MDLENYNCVLCNFDCEETSMHLFFKCHFSTACWNIIPICWNQNLPPLDMIIDARTTFGSPIFREIFITACWIIWVTRNAVIFDNGQANLSNWKRQFKEELDRVCTKAKPSRQDALINWKENFTQFFHFFSPLGIMALYFFFFCCSCVQNIFSFN